MKRAGMPEWHACEAPSILNADTELVSSAMNPAHEGTECCSHCSAIILPDCRWQRP